MNAESKCTGLHELEKFVAIRWPVSQAKLLDTADRSGSARNSKGRYFEILETASDTTDLNSALRRAL